MGSDTDNGEIDNFNWSSDDEEDKKNDILPSCSSAGISIGDIAGSGGIDNFDWSSDDEEDKKNGILASCSSAGISIRDIAGSGEASSSAGPSSSKSVSHFIGMGFSREMVDKAIRENGEGNTEAILETLLTYSALEKWPSDGQHVPSDFSSSGSERVILDDLSDDDSYFGNEENMENLTEEERTLKHLMDMGYPADEATIAMERCGPDSSIMELTDFICAAQMAKAADAHLRELPEDERPSYFNGGPSGDSREKRKRYFESEYSDNRKHRKLEKNLLIEDDSICLPNPMIGFGLPSEIPSEIPSEPWRRLSKRTIPEGAVGPPYFYYENVALAPKGVWTTISRFLYEIEPEFVDSKYFCAAARKRGYIHNLPIQNRSPLLPIPPQTINEALPLTKRWWPSWDRRTKLNCLQTCTASAKLTERLRKALEDWDDEPPLRVQKYVLEECKKWNLVWVGRNKVAPLEPDEIESLLGFPKNHTRGGGISRTERLKGLGNSFQVDTVAYHLSVLRDMYPGGISVLSLFSGIGGAEVALHRLGIPLKNVVSVEISETSRSILRSWWEQTNQRGNLIDICDVQQLDADRLEQLINSFGGFDLVIGGSPCNNISGSNRVSRDGLEDLQRAEHMYLEYGTSLAEKLAKFYCTCSLIIISLDDPVSSHLLLLWNVATAFTSKLHVRAGSPFNKNVMKMCLKFWNHIMIKPSSPSTVQAPYFRRQSNPNYLISRGKGKREEATK